MKFSHTIPPVTALVTGKETYHTVPAGVRLHRLHHGDFEATSFNPTPFGNARFSPIRTPGGAIIPTIYAGQSFACATSEIILRCPDAPPGDKRRIVHPSDFAEYEHSEIETADSFKLLDVTIAGQRRIGLDHNVLLAGPSSTYPATREWAEAIHASFPAAQGLYYLSYQYAPDYAVVLFGDRIDRKALAKISTRAVTQPDCHRDIARLADTLSIDYADV